MSDPNGRDLAIIGMACRFPQANHPAEFWANLQAGRESITPVPTERWPIDHYYHPTPGTPGKSVSRWGGFLDDVRGFDPAFFGINPAEAAVMDPQHRLLLEMAYEALASAGYGDEQRRAGLRVGVFIGISQSSYEEYTRPLLFSGRPVHPAMLADNLRNLAAGRLAYSLNLNGPALALDTACSSALVALHYARLSLLSGECDLALVGGINLNLTATAFVAFSSAGALSSSPHLYLFDERADGFVLGEGGGIVLLAPLTQAVAAGDPIMAVVKGSAVNNDGRSLGPMAPNPAGQQAVMAAAYRAAGLEPATVSYIEAHGTGTRIGDAVEVRSLSRIFPAESGPRYVGSVKTNVGHLLSGAGMASLLKVVLALQAGQIPPSLNCDRPRANLRLERAGLTVNRERVEWPAARPRRAGINAFGFGGTNAHLIIEEAPAPPAAMEAAPVPPYPFARQPYWVDSTPAVNLAPAVTAPVPPSVPRWLHRVHWQEYPLSLPASRAAARLLIVAADAEPANHLLAHLRAAGVTAELVALGHVESALATGGETCLVYLDSLTAGAEATAGETNNVNQLLAVAQAAGRLGPLGRPQTIVVFTAGAQPVAAGDEVRPRRAMVAGLAAALNEEIGIPSLVVDLDPAGNSDQYLAAMVAELGQRPQPAMIAWRQGKRYRRSLQAWSSMPAPSTGVPAPLRPDGVYLIVGGAGGIGAEIARRLTLDVAPAVILTGRTPLLSQSPQQAALLEKLRWAGARADYLACDVTDPAQVEALVAAIGRQHGQLTGVIFAAGTIQPGRLLSKTAAHFEAALAAKVQGVPLLWQTLQRHQLAPHFFVVFSSVASVMPGLAGGLGDYAAANAYVDAYAAATPGVTSINWTIWSEAGQGANAAILEHLARAGLEGIPSAEGYQLLKELAARRPSQVVVVNPEALAPRPTPAVERSLAPPVEKSPAVTAARPAEGVEAIRQQLQELLARELERAPAEVPLAASFASLGLDSMAALDLVLTLEQKGFGRLPPTLFFEYNTVEKLAHYLAQLASVPAVAAAITPPAAHEAGQPFPLSPVQLAFYTAHHIRPDEVAYAFVRQTVRGPLDKKKLQQAVNALVARHPMLRVTFDNRPADPQQLIRPADQPGVAPAIEWRPPVTAIETVEDEIVNQPLAITAGQIMRVAVLPDGDDPQAWHLLLHLHHIAADGWSLNLLAQELWLLYTDLLAGRPSLLPPPATHFREYVVQVGQEATEPARAFWTQRLAATAETALALPYDGPGQSAGPSDQRALRFTVGEELYERLKQQAAANDLSLFHLLLAVYYNRLRRWTGQERLVIGIAEARRDYPLADIQHVVGCMADVFPLHLTLKEGEPIIELAARVRDSWLELRPHLQLSSTSLARLRPATAGGERPLNPATFSFARFPAALPADAPLTIRAVLGRTATAATRLSLVCWEFAGQLHFTWNYPGYLFRPQTVATFTSDFLAALAVAAGTDGPAQQTATASRLASFLDQIEQQTQQNPQAIALDDGRRRCTYSQVAALSGRLAARLAEAGVQAGEVVAFLGEPSAEAIIALLAVLKMGSTWLPLESEYPTQRLGLMLAQTGARLLLYQPDTAALAARLQPPGLQTLAVTLADSPGPLPPPIPLVGERTAYIIFTSGSTGRPKGVPIPYHALDHYLNWAKETFAYGPADVVMQATALGFDASLRQCLVPLMSGATVVPIGRAVARDPRQLSARLVEAGITVWSSVPTLWLHLLAYLEKEAAAGRLPDLPRLRLIQLGGEALAAGALRRWYDLFGGRAQLANLYGPTETTINATYYLLPGRPEPAVDAVPIGQALPGVTLLVLDENGRPCPPGTTGELLVGGVGLSPGYLHDEPLTGRKFVTLPSWPGRRFFRTGDLVVERPDGNLVFAGRNDNQVKIRGHRIELGEIEAALAGHPAVSQAVAVAVPGSVGTELRIAAFLEAAGHKPAVAELRAHLQQSLPEAMIPQSWHWLAQLPLLSNGKVNRAQLVSLDQQGLVEASAASDGKTPLAGATEQIVAEVWQELLGVRPRWREDDFFALGGDSLNILALLVALEERGLSAPSAAELYRQRTLAQQAAILQPTANSPAMTVEAAAETGVPFPLSPAQVGFLMTRSFTPPLSTTWSARFCLEGPLELPLFEQALHQLLARHPMLRTVCLPAHRPPQQVEITPVGPLPLLYEDLQAEQAAGPAALAAALNQRQQADHRHLFDLARWPLIQMRLCRAAADRHYWFIAADHFMGDGLSGWLFGCELIQRYDRLAAGEALPPPPLRTTFRDYVTLALHKEQEIGAESRAFWQERFARPYVNPQHWYRPAEGSDGQWLHHVLELEPQQFNALKARAAARGQTAHDWLLALFGRQLGQLTGCADLVVGTANAGRDYALPDLMRIFGSFATILPVRLFLDPADDPAHQLEAAIAAFHRAQAHKLAPGQIARLLGSGVSLAAVSGLQFFFSFMDFASLGQPEGRHLKMNWELSQTELQPPRLGSDLVLAARTLNGRLRLTFTAGAHALDREGLAGFVAAFHNALLDLLPATPPAQTRRAAGTPLDAALVAYLPPVAEVEALLAELGIPAGAPAVRRLLFPHGQPRLLETVTTSIGRTGTICIPRFADELNQLPPAELAQEVAAAASLAAAQAARCISLAGMLPSHTRYGYALLEAMPAASRLSLTTGHSLTVVSVVKTIQHALLAVGYRPADLSLAVVGLGSIGTATLALYLSLADHPRRLMLCDLPAGRRRLHQVAAELRETAGYGGEIEIVESAESIPAGVYAADLIVGAASQANILDVARLRPGTIVVDDSFPHCFDRQAAVARMQAAQDVLLVGGGLLDSGPLERELHLPNGAPAAAGRLIGYLPTAGSPGCQLESLLHAHLPQLPLTHGLVTLANAQAYWQAVEALGWRPARLHLGNFTPETLWLRQQ